MANSLLPVVQKDKSLKLNHFPTTIQAFVFRMWEMIPISRLAKVLKTSEKNVCKLAVQMGLPPRKTLDGWLEKGYISIIRSCWHIIPYHQLLELLDWNEEKLAYILKEDDFLAIKLGSFKPFCEEITYRELTVAELEQTQMLKVALLRDVRTYDLEETARPFDFPYMTKDKKQSRKMKVAEYDVELTSAWTVVDQSQAEETAFLVASFIDEYNTAWDLNIQASDTETNSSIVLKIDANLQYKMPEYHEIKIQPHKIEIVAVGVNGILRGLNRLEELSKKVGGPYYKTAVYSRKPNFETRFIYSFCGLYGNAFDTDSSVSYPDELLRAYAKVGVNGIWLQAVLYRMVEFPFEPSLCEGWEKRLNHLIDLVKRAKKYGISVYLYINEPRSMPLAFYKKYPDMQGHVIGEYACMCTSSPQVLQYLQQAITQICTKVTDLGGFFTITRSENPTNCYSHTSQATQDCPRCKNRSAAQVVAEVNATIAQAASAVNPSIKTFAWTWQWIEDNFATEEEAKLCISQMPENVIVMCTSEQKLDYTIAGMSGKVVDYTMSQIGPSELSKRMWHEAKKTNHQTAAKVQINNTWECSTVPYIPVYESVIKHMKNLKEVNVDHIMLSWTLGGYPSENLKIASSFFFEELGIGDTTFYKDALMSAYGEDYHGIQKAVSVFCEAFSEFPFHLKTLYRGPQNGGPSNLLFEGPTGLDATLTCYAYDDLEQWRSIYPVDVFENQFRLISEKWKMGMEMLSGVSPCDFIDVATACYTIFKSSYNQIRFIRLRDKYIATKCEAQRNSIVEILKDELSNAISAYRIMLRNPSIGYEAANHYYFTRSMLMEKVVCCDYLLQKYGR